MIVWLIHFGSMFGIILVFVRYNRQKYEAQHFVMTYITLTVFCKIVLGEYKALELLICPLYAVTEFICITRNINKGSK